MAAFVAIALLRSPKRNARSWMVRLAIALPLCAAVFWIVYRAIPDARLGFETLAIVATFAFVSGLAADELIGADLRRILNV